MPDALFHYQGAPARKQPVAQAREPGGRDSPERFQNGVAVLPLPADSDLDLERARDLLLPESRRYLSPALEEAKRRRMPIVPGAQLRMDNEQRLPRTDAQWLVARWEVIPFRIAC